MFKRFKIKKWLLPIIIATVLSIGALRMVVTWAESGDIWSLQKDGTDVIRVNSSGTLVSASVAITGGTISGITALAVTLTDHGVLTGSGTSAITALTVGTDNQVLRGITGADPAFGALVDADVPNALTISGGTVNNSVIGGSVPAAGAFTTLTASGATTLTSTLNYLTEVVACDTDTAVLAANSGAVHTNAGATTAVIYTLPTASAGLTFLFSSVATDTTLDMTITAASGDKINGGGAAGSYAATATEEKRACTIIAVDATNWRVISEVGTWAN